MAFTVGGAIRSALRKIGVLAPGEALPANEGDDGLEVFRQMVDDWANETLLIPIVSDVLFALSSNVSEYTIGIYPEPKPVPLPVNHIETSRPERIIAAFIRDGSQTDYPIELMDIKTYSRISRKTNGSRPSRMYVQEGWPLNELRFESTPYADETLHLAVVQPLSELLPTTGLTEVIDLPPGYERALIYNLCLELAPEYGKDISQLIANQAVQSKLKLKRNNYRSLVLGMDRALATQRKGIGTYIIDQGP